MRTLARLLLFFFVISSTPLFAADNFGYERRVIAGKVWTVPDYINIEVFPPLGGKLTDRDARILRLHKDLLDKGGWFVNELRDRHTFEVMWIEKGTEVWMSGFSREPRYLVSCGNRISPLLAHNVTMYSGTSGDPTPAVKESPAKPSLMQRFWNLLFYWPTSWPRITMETNPNGQSTVHLY